MVALELFEILVPRLEADRREVDCYLYIAPRLMLLFLDVSTTLVASEPMRLFARCYKFCTFRVDYD